MHNLLAEHNLQSQVGVDSAGTGAWHTGEPADTRSRACAQKRGIMLSSRSRQVTTGDFDRFDLLLAMDQNNLADLVALASPSQQSKIHLFRSFDPGATNLDVPDPYYGGDGGFDKVYDICVSGCNGLLAHLRANYPLVPTPSQ